MLGWSTCQIFGWVISVVAVILGYVQCFLFLHKYMVVKRTRILRDLTAMSFAIVSALAGLPIFFVVSRYLPTQDAADRLINIQTAFSFSGTAIGNLFLLSFIKSVFFENKMNMWMKALIFLEIIVIPSAPVVTILDLEPLLVLGPHAIASIVIYTIEAVKAFNITKHLKITNGDPVSINGTMFIGLSGLFLDATIFLFVMQEITFATRDVFEPLGLIDAVGCSLFVAAGLVAAMIAIAMLYLGYYVPDWIKKRWLARASRSRPSPLLG
ncbi:MAG: hypothetical protein Q6373_021710 [Candidatus Sigynarchaeota archaeon]